MRLVFKRCANFVAVVYPALEFEISGVGVSRGGSLANGERTSPPAGRRLTRTQAEEGGQNEALYALLSPPNFRAYEAKSLMCMDLRPGCLPIPP